MIQEMRKANLIKLIQEAGGKNTQLAAKTGMDASYISQMKNGTRAIGEKTARNIERSLELNEGWLDQQHDSEAATITQLIPKKNNNVVTVAMLGAKASQGTGISADLVDHDQVVRTIETTKSWLNLVLPPFSGADNLRIITGLGMSMRPLYNDGDLLWCDTGIRTLDQDAVYALRANGELFIKHVRRNPANNTIELISENKTYGTMVISDKDDFQVIGKILGVLNFNKF